MNDENHLLSNNRGLDLYKLMIYPNFLKIFSNLRKITPTKYYSQIPLLLNRIVSRRYPRVTPNHIATLQRELKDCQMGANVSPCELALALSLGCPQPYTIF